MRVGINSNHRNISFKADVRVPLRKQELVFALGEHIEKAYLEDLPKIKQHGDDSYVYSFFRDYEHHPRRNSQNVWTHLSDNIKIYAIKRNGIFGLEQGPSVLVEGGVKFFEAAQKAKEILDGALAKKKKPSYLDD